MTYKVKTLSRAPEPINPLSSHPMKLPKSPEPPPAKWAKWRHMRDVELWEAVALSLDMEPSALPVYLRAFDALGDDPFRICPSSFLERLEIANSSGGISLPMKVVHKLKARCLVDLPGFGVWASNIWNPLPGDFPIQADAGSGLSSVPSPKDSNVPAGKVWTEERKAEVRAYRDEHGLKKTAEHYEVSQATISKHVPAGKGKATTGKAKTLGPFEGLGRR